MAGFRFRLIDTAGSELAIVTYAVPHVRVVEVYDDEVHGQEGGVQATLVVDG